MALAFAVLAGLTVTTGVATARTAAVGPTCKGRDLCVGAAAVSVSPDQRYIDGVMETRLFVPSRLQRFNLGGYGINPLQALPDPDGSIGGALTVPASQRVFTGSHGPEPISVRAMVISEPHGDTVALVTLDAIGAGNVIQDHLTRAVAAATGIPAANVLFGQTHTHAGPDLQGLWGGVPAQWIARQLYPGAVRAVREALRTSTPSRLAVRSSLLDDFNGYRRPKRVATADTDRRSTLLQAEAISDGRVVANLLQYDAHPTSVNEPERVPHPDYVLGARDWLEAHAGGVALYFNGPIADASPSGSRPGCSPGTDGKYGQVRCRGEGIAAATLARTPGPPLLPTVEVHHQRVVLPVTNPAFIAAGAGGAFNRYYDFQPLPLATLPGGPELRAALEQLPSPVATATTTISRITIGGATSGVEIVTIPGEATGTFGTWLRGLASPWSHVMLLGLTHDSLGYILPEDEFSYIDPTGGSGLILPFTGYEEFVSLGPLTAPLLRAEGYAPLFDVDPATVLTRCEARP